MKEDVGLHNDRDPALKSINNNNNNKKSVHRPADLYAVCKLIKKKQKEEKQLSAVA